MQFFDATISAFVDVIKLVYQISKAESEIDKSAKFSVKKWIQWESNVYN